MLIDSHAHLNFNAYKDDLANVIKRNIAQGTWVINVGTKYETSKKAVEIAEEYDGNFAAIGMHPIHIKTDLVKFKTDPEEGAFETLGEDFNKDRYLELANSPKVVAIGEIGLDYYYRPKTTKKLEEFKNKQKEIFLKQLDMAAELNLPVIFHCRMAHKDLVDILKGRPKIRGVIHCFTGTQQEADQYVKLGFYIGLNGIIFKLDLDNVIKNIPIGNILIETDCPYLTPPQAGAKETRNEPSFVKHVAERIAELKGIAYDDVADITTNNAKDLFNI